MKECEECLKLAAKWADLPTTLRSKPGGRYCYQCLYFMDVESWVSAG